MKKGWETYMLQIGDRVIYGIHGVCTIVDDTVRVMNQKRLCFYVLEPLDQNGARFYLPAENPVTLAKLRPLLSREELDMLLASPEIRSGSWIQDENRRKQYYRELMTKGDRIGILQMVYQLHLNKRQQEAQGRKFHLCDENFLKDAQKLLEAEFSLVLEMEFQQVAEYVTDALEK